MSHFSSVFHAISAETNLRTAAVLLNANYLWVSIHVPTQFSLRCENAENYLANDLKQLVKSLK